jgi:hypothetical protein
MIKIMKKAALCATVICGFSLLVSSQSFAQVISTQAGGSGTTINVPDTNGNGPGLNYNPSPNIFGVVVSTEVNYAIQTMNSSIADDDRNEYAVWNANTGYYMQTNPDMAGTTVVVTDFTVDLAANTDITASPYTAWPNFGGGGS